MRMGIAKSERASCSLVCVQYGSQFRYRIENDFCKEEKPSEKKSGVKRERKGSEGGEC